MAEFFLLFILNTTRVVQCKFYIYILLLYLYKIVIQDITRIVNVIIIRMLELDKYCKKIIYLAMSFAEERLTQNFTSAICPLFLDSGYLRLLCNPRTLQEFYHFNLLHLNAQVQMRSDYIVTLFIQEDYRNISDFVHYFFLELFL